MAGFTDASERRMCRRHGCDITVSEMISAKAMCFGDEKTACLAEITEDEGQTLIQLFGHEPESMAAAAEMIASGNFPRCSYKAPPAAIDINMGCPVKKIVSSGDGSALMKNPPLAGEIVAACVKAVEKYNMPVTVKIRSGWDKDSVNAPEFAKRLASSGASCIAVHARTRDQMYAPSADIGVIKAVREALPDGFPLVGNGDIACAADALKMLSETGCDSLMIGRAALGNPWIFEEIKAAVQKKPFTPPKTEEKLAEALRLIRELIEKNGEKAGVCMARGRAAHFIKGLRGASALRGKINRAETYAEIEELVTDFAEELPEDGDESY